MKLIKNTGNDRVIDELRQTFAPPSSLDLASPAFSLFAFAELRDLLEKLDACRVVLPATNGDELGLTGSKRTALFGIAFNSAGSPANVPHGSRRKWSCAVLRPCCRNPSSSLANRIQSFIVSSPATVLSQLKVWGSLPAINSV